MSEQDLRDQPPGGAGAGTATDGAAPVVAGRFEVLGPLGRGGMGHVQLAFDRALGRRVALKAAPATGPADGRTVARLRREARVVAMLGHPNIVAVHDVVLDAGTAYIVMELVSGAPLSAMLPGRPLAPERAVEVAAGVASALAHAHAAGVVHGDVSPSNVMLTPAAGVKVLDFGIARAAPLTPPTDPRSAFGTLEYVAPEQVRGGPVDARSDLYSLGALLFLMLTGRPPFTGDAAAVMHAHLHAGPPRPSDLAPGIPPELDDLVARCLAKDPARRPQRAEEVGSELARIGARLAGGRSSQVADRSDQAETAPVARGPWTTELRGEEPPGRRRPGRWVAAVAGALVVLLAGVALAAWMLRPRPAPARTQPSPARTSAPPPILAPAGLRANGRCGGFLAYTAALRWRAPASFPIDGYRVYRASRPEGPYRVIGEVAGRSSTAYRDHGLGSSTDYYYVVRGVEGRRLGPPSGVALAHTPFVCLS